MSRREGEYIFFDIDYVACKCPGDNDLGTNGGGDSTTHDARASEAVGTMVVRRNCCELLLYHEHVFNHRDILFRWRRRVTT